MEEIVLTNTRGNIASYPSRRKIRTEKMVRQSQPLNLEEESNLTTSDKLPFQHQAA
jgi:hypothetical protein